ncbi:sigma-70 family RNA polymerase sigma factor [Actinomadura sp. KC216]|uniref:sigma-70 family RNA polymerase sigma factor n=1 Tax=Actinomadura sp. KC216 TaxID=2530370 RepID=UPI00104E07FC|nr:sigma-70 family RNA polymerase sigma factor [Actinomadura sp. KC216]TDB81438.1 sigma-70 family RNA polymerase sigma factor [Actinomadura sp. KC216]
MDGDEFLADAFEQHRPHLRSVAYRMLGSSGEADDALQEAWLRASRAGVGEVENIGGWLTTIVGRVSLNMLRSRSTRREDPLDDHVPSASMNTADAAGNGRATPEDEAVLADSVGHAMLVVLDTLAPAERLAFVLHDMFAMSFDEIAPIVERTPAATRQLASRARRRVQDAPAATGHDLPRLRQVVDAFLAASRAGEFEELLALLDPEVLLRADAAGVATGAPALVRGASAVAETFSGRARATRPALIDGAAGLVWSVGGRPRVVFDFTIVDGRIVAIDLLADPDTLAQLDLEIPTS